MRKRIAAGCLALLVVFAALNALAETMPPLPAGAFTYAVRWSW